LPFLCPLSAGGHTLLLTIAARPRFGAPAALLLRHGLWRKARHPPQRLGAHPSRTGNVM